MAMLPPERRGLLTLGGFLTLFARPIDTSPTQRGLFVRERLLCEELAPPPQGVVASLPAPEPGQRLTNRERVEMHLSDAVCASCHRLMDPLGLPLEGFDGIGQYRETDQGLPLDLTGDLDGEAFDGPLEFAALLVNDPRTADCVVKQLYRHATGRVERSDQLVAIDALSETYGEAGHSIMRLLEELIVSEAFRTAGEPQ